MQNNNLEVIRDEQTNAKSLIEVSAQVPDDFVNAELDQAKIDDNQDLPQLVYFPQRDSSSSDSDEESNKANTNSVFMINDNNDEEKDMMVLALLGIKLLFEEEQL